MELLLAVINTAFGIVAIVLTIHLARVGRQLSRPKLHFNVGHSGVHLPSLAKKFQKLRVTTLLYGAATSSSAEIYVILPLLLENRGRQPLTNVRVQLHYSEINAVRDLAKVSDSFGVRYNAHPRTVSVPGRIAQVALEENLIRPGEKLMLCDVLRFRTKRSTASAASEGNDYLASLTSNLQSLPDFGDFVVVDIAVVSEQLPPVYHRVNVLWFRTADWPALGALAGRVRGVFWGGSAPAKGLYLKSMFEEFNFSLEASEIIVPKLQWDRSSAACDLGLSSADSPYHLYAAVMPKSDYLTSAPTVRRSWIRKRLGWD